MTFFLLISFTQSPFWKIENIENQFLYNNCSTELRSHTWKKIPLLPKSKFWRHLLRAKQKKKITQIFSFLVPKSIKKVCFFKKSSFEKPQQILRKKVPHLIFVSMFFWVQFWSLKKCFQFFFQNTFLAHIQCNILQPTNSHHVFWFASHTKWKKKSEQNVQSLFFFLRLKT